MTEQSVDLLFLAFNRLEFTQESFNALLKNTDWQYIQQLSVYDDGSVDGTRDWLLESIRQVPAIVAFRETQRGSVVQLMIDWLDSATAPILAKCDNDAVYPPGWLRVSLDVLDRYPELDLLGIESFYECSTDVNLSRGYKRASFISGLGLYRRSAFLPNALRALGRYGGLEQWQLDRPRIIRGWLRPSLPVFLLDRLPIEPWASLSDRYVAAGWQRTCARYPATRSTLWDWRWGHERSWDAESQERGPLDRASSAGDSSTVPTDIRS